MQPPNHHLHRVLIAVGTLTLLTLTPSATSQSSFVEGFEDLTPPESPATNDDYTFSLQSTGSSTSTTAQANSGTNSLRLNGDAFGAGFQTSQDLCGGTSWWIRYSAFPTTNGYGMGLTDGIETSPFRTSGLPTNAHEWIAIYVTTTGVVNYQIDSNNAGGASAPGSLGITLSLNTWYNFSITCPLVGVSGTVTLYETTTDTVVQIAGQQFDTQALSQLWFSGNPNGLGGAGAYNLYLDDLAFPFSQASPGVIFCSDPGLSPGEDGSIDDFGYEYVEDWTYDSNLATEFGPTDGFVATESDGGSAYMGKGFDTGSMAIAVKFTIEAAVEGQDSVFRAAFTEGNSGTPSNANKGDGTDGGNFDDHVGIRFEEEGNNWRITFRQNIAGAGYNTIGASFTHGNPNTATSYNFTVDSRDLTATLLDSDGEVIATRTIDAAFQDEIWEDQWFVATGTNALLPATTVLDDQTGQSETSDGSTCIYDLIGGAEASNTAGGDDQSTIPDIDEPPASDCDSALCVDAANVPDGWTAAALNGFLGVLLVAGIAVGGTVGIYGEKPAGKISGLVVGGFLGLGYLVALYFGLLPIWPLVLVAIVGAVVVFLKLRSGA